MVEVGDPPDQVTVFAFDFVQVVLAVGLVTVGAAEYIVPLAV